MANMTTTTNAVFIPEVWSNNILDEVEKNLVMANLVTRFDEDVSSFGDTIHIPTVSGLTAGTKAASTDVTFEADTETEVSLSVNQHKYAAFKLEDITRIQARDDLRSRYTARAGYSIAAAIDSTLTALESGLSQNVTGGTALDDADIIAAVELLDAADAPRDGRSFVVHSEGMADLRAVNKFVAYDQTGAPGVGVGAANGLVANVYGTDVFMSNNISIESGTPDLVHNLMFHKEAFGLAVQQAPKVEADYNVASLAWEVVAHTIYGAVELRDTFGVDVTLNS